jgi:hypothetical protein
VDEENQYIMGASKKPEMQGSIQSWDLGKVVGAGNVQVTIMFLTRRINPCSKIFRKEGFTLLFQIESLHKQTLITLLFIIIAVLVFTNSLPNNLQTVFAGEGLMCDRFFPSSL